MDQFLRKSHSADGAGVTSLVVTSKDSLALPGGSPIAIQNSQVPGSLQNYGHRKYVSEPIVASCQNCNLNLEVSPFTPVQSTNYRRTVSEMSSSGEEEVVYDNARASALRNRTNRYLAHTTAEQTQFELELEQFRINHAASSIQDDVRHLWDEQAHANSAASPTINSDGNFWVQRRHDFHDTSSPFQYDTRDFRAGPNDVDNTTSLHQDRVRMLWDAHTEGLSPDDLARTYALNGGQYVAMSPSLLDLATDQTSDGPSQLMDYSNISGHILPYLLAEYPDIRPTPTMSMVERAGGVSSQQPLATSRRMGKLAEMIARHGRLTWQRFGYSNQNNKSAPPVMSKKLLDASARDGLTLVGSRQTAWHDYVTKNAGVDWPPLGEFGKYGGKFPSPRIQKIADGYVHFAEAYGSIPLTGPGVPYNLRKVAEFCRHPADDGVTTEEYGEHRKEAKEIQEGEIHGFLKEFLEEIEP